MEEIYPLSPHQLSRAGVHGDLATCTTAATTIAAADADTSDVTVYPRGTFGKGHTVDLSGSGDEEGRGGGGVRRGLVKRLARWR